MSIKENVQSRQDAEGSQREISAGMLDDISVFGLWMKNYDLRHKYKVLLMCENKS